MMRHLNCVSNEASKIWPINFQVLLKKKLAEGIEDLLNGLNCLGMISLLSNSFSKYSDHK